MPQNTSADRWFKTIIAHLNLRPHADPLSRCSLINYGADLTDPLMPDHNTHQSEWEHDEVAFSPNLTVALNLQKV